MEDIDIWSAGLIIITICLVLMMLFSYNQYSQMVKEFDLENVAHKVCHNETIDTRYVVCATDTSKYTVPFNCKPYLKEIEVCEVK